MRRLLAAAIDGASAAPSYFQRASIRVLSPADRVPLQLCVGAVSPYSLAPFEEAQGRRKAPGN